MAAMNEELRRIIHQNEIIISLLGRVAFTKEDVKRIVTFKKRKPEKYVEGYNACDGNHSLSEVAEIIGVTSGTLSPILADWEEAGILYEIDRPKGKFYKKILPI